jgi:hypothetical protein
MGRLWSLGVSLFFLEVKFTSLRARLFWLLVRFIELPETFQTIVELNHGKVDNISSGNMKLLNLTFLSPVYQLFIWYFKQWVIANN